MKTLQEIKDEVAQRHEFRNWTDLMLLNNRGDIDAYFNEVAIACQEQLRRDCAERAQMTIHCGTFKTNKSTTYYQIGADNLQVDKQAILETPLIK